MKIKDLRVNFGLTQARLANLLGCNQTAVGKYERGDLEPNVETLKKLADIFDVSVDYLIGRTDDFGNVAYVGEMHGVTKEEKELLTCFNKLAPYEREAIMIQIKALASKDSAIKK